MFNLNAVLAFFVSREYETIKEFYLLFILLERTELRAASINSCMSVGERQRIHGGGGPAKMQIIAHCLRHYQTSSINHDVRQMTPNSNPHTSFRLNKYKAIKSLTSRS